MEMDEVPNKDMVYTIQTTNEGANESSKGKRDNSGVFQKSVHRNSLVSENKFVRIIPVQTDRRHRDLYGKIRVMKRKWKPHLGRYFHKDLTPEKLEYALILENVKMENVSIIENPEFIFYQYKGKPLIALNVKDGQYYTTQWTIDKYGLDYPQQQAHILTQILKKNSLSSAILGRAKFMKET